MLLDDRLVAGRPRLCSPGVLPSLAQAPCADGIARFGIRRGQHQRPCSSRPTLRLLALPLAMPSEAVEP